MSYAELVLVACLHLDALDSPGSLVSVGRKFYGSVCAPAVVSADDLYRRYHDALVFERGDVDFEIPEAVGRHFHACVGRGINLDLAAELGLLVVELGVAVGAVNDAAERGLAGEPELAAQTHGAAVVDVVAGGEAHHAAEVVRGRAHAGYPEVVDCEGCFVGAGLHVDLDHVLAVDGELAGLGVAAVGGGELMPVFFNFMC